VELLERDRRWLDILSVKKEAKLTAIEIPEVVESIRGFTVYEFIYGLPEALGVV